MAVEYNYKIVDELYPYKVSVGEMCLSKTEKLHNLEMKSLLDKVSTACQNNGRMLFKNSASNTLSMKLPFLVSNSKFYNQGTYTDFIYGVEVDVITKKLYEQIPPNFVIVANLANVFGSGDTANDWDHNVIPYYDGSSSVYLHCGTSGYSKDSDKNKVLSTINEYNKDHYFVVESARNKSFIVKGAASLVSINAVHEGININFYAKYDSNESKYKIGSQSIKVNLLVVEMIYTGNYNSTNLPDV